MRKKFSIDAKKVFACEMTAPVETILVAQVVNISRRGGGGGGGGEGYFLISHIGLRRFGLKTGKHFALFGLESGMVFEGTTYMECVNVISVSFPNE